MNLQLARMRRRVTDRPIRMRHRTITAGLVRIQRQAEVIHRRRALRPPVTPRRRGLIPRPAAATRRLRAPTRHLAEVTLRLLGPILRRAALTPPPAAVTAVVGAAMAAQAVVAARAAAAVVAAARTAAVVVALGEAVAARTPTVTKGF